MGVLAVHQMEACARDLELAKHHHFQASHLQLPLVLQCLETKNGLSVPAVVVALLHPARHGAAALRAEGILHPFACRLSHGSGCAVAAEGQGLVSAGYFAAEYLYNAAET